MPDRAIIRKSTEDLLKCGDDFAVMKQSVDQMYQVFSGITGVTIDQLNRDKDIMLPSGKAISTASAAHCLLQMKRTTVFLRGTNKAILQKIKEKKDTRIRILYAGTGPYGTLVIPLLLLYSPEEITVDLLDINSTSLTALYKVIETLELDNYIGEVYCADASTIKLMHQYDIVISETMQACLKKEPQVAIMQNLIPQCSADTIFVPEQITIDAYLKKKSIWNEDRQPVKGGETKFLEELFSVNKGNLDNKNYRKVIDLPESLSGPYDLLLYTTITVFGNEVLGVNESSLNMPLKYCELHDNYPGSIELWYNQTDMPKIEYKFLNYNTL